MLKTHSLVAASVAAAILMAVSGGALAQASKAGGGKIVCWKDNAGKVVGCGDRVPAEYQDSATKELDRTGVTRKTSETTAERLKREAEEKTMSAQKADEKKRLEEQRRQDAALINTFSNEKEIDLKRDRDLQVVETQMSQHRVVHKNAVARVAEMKKRIDAAQKENKAVSEYNKEELARAEAEQAKAEQAMAANEKERAELTKRYADMKQRYMTLRGLTPASTAAAKKK
jgi:hypothetical protein